MVKLSNKTNLLEVHQYEYALQDIAEPNLYPVITMTEDDTAEAVFNISETLLPQIVDGKHFEAEVPALGKRIGFEVSHISVEADFATQSATSARGDFDIRTFEVRMKPLSSNVPLRAGMSVIIELQKPAR